MFIWVLFLASWVQPGLSREARPFPGTPAGSPGGGGGGQNRDHTSLQGRSSRAGLFAAKPGSQGEEGRRNLSGSSSSCSGRAANFPARHRPHSCARGPRAHSAPGRTLAGALSWPSEKLNLTITARRRQDGAHSCSPHLLPSSCSLLSAVQALSSIA